MRTLLNRYSRSATAVYWSLLLLGLTEFAQGSDNVLPPAAEMSGLNVEASFPRGCVDCHVNMPERNQDERLSSIMSSWALQVPPELLEKARSVVRNGEALKGRHPKSDKMFQAIPGNCVDCHEHGSGSVVPFIPLIHLIHLSGGEENHYLKIFRGQCTHCHKLDPNTGRMKVPSAPE